MRLLLSLLVAATGTACATAGHTPQPFPRPGPHAPSATVPAASSATGPADGYSVTGTALALRGTPYRSGGTDPNGFDCSGFVSYVYAQHGVHMPRTVGELWKVGKAVDAGALQPGDLVFFDTTGGGATHVGISLGGDEFVHAPSSSGEVRVERLSARYWASRFVGGKRVLQTVH